METARAIAHHYQTGFVVLDAEHQIARVVFDDVTVDFAQQVGNSLNTDLHRRDFTINAIAYHPHSQTLVDPLGGQSDLHQRVIHMISQENLEEDPLRLLRAYRQAAQLGFVVDEETDSAIRDLAPLLNQVAPERVYNELSYLLSHSAGTAKLFRVFDNHLLDVWLPHATRHAVQCVDCVDHAVEQATSIWPDLKQALLQWPRDQQHATGGGRSWLKVSKLACLVNQNLDCAEAELRQLKCSRLEIQSVLTVLRQIPLIKSGEMTRLCRRDQFFLFKEVGDVFPAVAMMAIAHGISTDSIAPLIDKFLSPGDSVAHPIPLVTGRDIMAALNLSPGPQVGALLSQVQIAQAEGRINTAEEALSLASQLLSTLAQL